MSWVAPFAIASSLATALLYAAIAVALGQRRALGGLQAPITLLRVWWTCLAAVTLLTPLEVYLFGRGELTLGIFQWLTEVAFLLLCLALWALLCYLVFLYTGSRRLWGAFGAAYAAFAVVLLALVDVYLTSGRLASTGWGVQLDPQPQLPAWGNLLFLVALVGPQLGASVAYLLLLRHATDATTRYRIALVGCSILVWFGSAFAAGLAAIRSDAWQATARLIGLASGVAILLAYFPPRPWQRRWGLRSLGREA